MLLAAVAAALALQFAGLYLPFLQELLHTQPRPASTCSSSSSCPLSATPPSGWTASCSAARGYWILRSTGGVDGFNAPWSGFLGRELPTGTAIVSE